MTTDLAAVPQLRNSPYLAERDREAAQVVAPYLGHLSATGQSMPTIKQARSTSSHFRNAVGMQMNDNSALHSTVAEM